MHPAQRRHPAGSARYRRSAIASRPSRRRTDETICNRDGSAPRRPSPRKISARSSELLPLLDSIAALRIDHRHQPDDAAVATIPVPREEREGAALAGDLVDVATDVLDAEDTVLEQDAMHRLPFREILLPVAATRPLLVFLRQMRMQRTIALRPDGGSERMVIGLGVVAHNLDLLFDEPLARRRHKARRPTEVIFIVLV